GQRTPDEAALLPAWHLPSLILRALLDRVFEADSYRSVHCVDWLSTRRLSRAWPSHGNERLRATPYPLQQPIECRFRHLFGRERTQGVILVRDNRGARPQRRQLAIADVRQAGD